MSFCLYYYNILTSFELCVYYIYMLKWQFANQFLVQVIAKCSGVITANHWVVSVILGVSVYITYCS